MGTTYNSNIVTDGLVLCLDAANPRSYPLSGNTWLDLSGQGNNGTLTNGPTFNSANGGSIVFDGTNDYTSVAHSSSISFGHSSSFTIEAIFSADSYSQSSIISRRDLNGSDTTDYIFFYQGGYFYFGIGNSTDSGAWAGGKTTEFNYSNTVMYACGVVQSSGAQTGAKLLYKNGNLLSEVSYSAKASSFTKSTLLGSLINRSDFYFDGKLYGIKIYNRALSADEVRRNYNATRGRYGY